MSRIQRSVQFTILAAGASAGAANAQTFTDTFNYAASTATPPAPSFFFVTIGSAMGQPTSQYLYQSATDPADPAGTKVTLLPSAGNQVNGSGLAYSQTTAGGFSSATPSLDFLINGQQYTGTANLVYDAGAQTLTLTTVQYQAVAAATPEPAAWALLIGGFGAAGGALRRRRRAGRLAAA